jgi:RNA polymerase sigma-70 factor (ECF subfamily)
MITGDLTAFDALYSRYFQTVFNNIYSIVKDRQHAEDILQEAFLALWEKRATLKHPENIAGWLFVTSSNKSLNLLKKQIRERLNIQSIESGAEDIQYVHVDTNLADNQLAILKKAIGNLSPQQRKVFEMCKLEGKSYEETAETLNLSKNTVKTHMRQAVSNIRDHVLHDPDMALLVPSCLLILAHLSV